ncbi:restriction endonuclease subunit S [Acinetobacter sp. VNK23]|uniref:restriction endonuclease subunit S n=1 Tax=Acinetobacter thutiue TaxID=2998078 RepID=UPI002577B396|nr:restriction endonuclease subunit S [Acinetobacter thutiue]MDM1020165.1 restriction endonuclease subunit S [Acinetobacter thutiue]
MSVPKLRFKEFDGNWSEISFQDLFIFKNGVNASKEQYGSGIKFINVLDIINNPNGITYNSIIGSVDITSKEIEKNLVKYGDVLFQRSSETREEVGQSNVYLGKDPVVFGGFVIRGSAQKEYDPIFMNGLLKTDSLRDQITQLSGGSTRFNIGQDSLNKVSAYLPLKEEQTQIASFLSAVDEKISQLTQKHELLSQYKQGMMQKLFSQQIRFKADDGSEFGEWEDGSLGDITAIQGGYAFKSNSFGKGATKVLRIGDIRNNIFLDCFDGVNSDEIPDARYLVSNDAIVMALSGATFGKLGKVKIGSAYINQRVATFKVNEKTTNEYVYQIMLSKDFFNYIQSIPSASAQPNISNQDVLNFEMLIPCLEEQTKIANFLSAIDQKIEVVARQLEQAKQWKKGLLQQMFV